MKVVLHVSNNPYRSSRKYLVSDTELSIVSTDTGRGWKILISPGGEDEWSERNQDLFEMRFDRLRDARTYLEALFAVDPPSEMELLPWRLLQRQPDGSYLAKPSWAPTNGLRVQREPPTRGWHVYDASGQKQYLCRNLWVVRLVLGTP